MSAMITQLRLYELKCDRCPETVVAPLKSNTVAHLCQIGWSKRRTRWLDVMGQRIDADLCPKCSKQKHPDDHETT